MTNLVQFRRTLHQFPELSGQEKETAERIILALKELNPTEIITQIGGYGIIAIYDTGKVGKSILYRADMDALPIQEVNDFEYQSKYQGVSHKCGHDGHSTILLGLAHKLVKQPLSKGKYILLFQPAEETGEGANAVLKDKKFADIIADYAFALHNIPGHPKGQIIYRRGAFNPAVISLVIHLEGLKTHAAEQENGINPDLALANLIQKIKALHHNDFGSEDFCNITTVHVNLGSLDYGTAAGNASLHFTIRCWTKEKLTQLQNQIVTIIQGESTKYQLKYRLEWLHYFAATANDDHAVEYIQQATESLGYKKLEKRFPFKWGEDFGLFTQHFKGAMFGLGAGESTPPLHQTDYDFPDEIIPFGVELFYKIAQLINQ